MIEFQTFSSLFAFGHQVAIKVHSCSPQARSGICHWLERTDEFAILFAAAATAAAGVGVGVGVVVVVVGIYIYHHHCYWLAFLSVGLITFFDYDPHSMLLFSTFVSLAHDEHGDECDNFLLFCYTQTMDILPVTMYPMEKGSLGWLNVCCQTTIFNPWCEMTSLFQKGIVGYLQTGLRKTFCGWRVIPKSNPKSIGGKSQLPGKQPLRREVVPPQHWKPLKPAIQLPKIMVLSYVFFQRPSYRGMYDLTTRSLGGFPPSFFKGWIL